MESNTIGEMNRPRTFYRPERTSEIGRRKVKSGCRTCKVRKVKCDEGWPACHRCVSTGRTCDGYGIWGGGSRVGIRPPHAETPLATTYRFPMLGDIRGEEEHRAFDWFRLRASRKLPGPFESPFWEQLILRLSCSEPALLHAVLALAALHRREAIDDTAVRLKSDAPNRHERFALNHYSRAIQQLQPWLSTNTRSSVRIVLAACMIFICIEFVRGHHRTGIEHLKTGMQLVLNMACRKDTTCDPTDQWLTEVFAQSNLQVALLRQGVPGLRQLASSPEVGPPPLDLNSMNGARKGLDYILVDVLDISQQEYRMNVAKDRPLPAELLNRWHRARSDLTVWVHAFEASRGSLRVKSDPIQDFGYQVLALYYIMIDIIVAAGTRHHEEGEMAYDTQISRFSDLMIEAIRLKKRVASKDLLETPLRHDDSDLPFTSDRGWIPPLYFAALKCRDPRTRSQFAQLLLSIESHEGVWNWETAALIAQEVIDLEQGGFYMAADDAYLDEGNPDILDFTLPVLPASQRVQDVQVTLPDGPLDRMSFTCRRNLDHGRYELIQRHYDPHLQIWTGSRGYDV